MTSLLDSLQIWQDFGALVQHIANRRPQGRHIAMLGSHSLYVSLQKSLMIYTDLNVKYLKDLRSTRSMTFSHLVIQVPAMDVKRHEFRSELEHALRACSPAARENISLFAQGHLLATIGEINLMVQHLLPVPKPAASITLPPDHRCPVRNQTLTEVGLALLKNVPFDNARYSPIAEALEREGQQELLRAGGAVLPVEGSEDPLLRAVGFEFGPIFADHPQFRSAKLPLDWKLQAIPKNPFVTLILDPEGRARFSIQYKAGPWHRYARIKVEDETYWKAYKEVLSLE